MEFKAHITPNDRHDQDIATPGAINVQAPDFDQIAECLRSLESGQRLQRLQELRSKALADERLTKTNCRVLDAIINMVNWKAHGYCYPTVKAIATRCSNHRSTIFRSLNTLEEAGYLLRENRIRSDNPEVLTSNKYTLPLLVVSGPSQGRDGVVAVSSTKVTATSATTVVALFPARVEAQRATATVAGDETGIVAHDATVSESLNPQHVNNEPLKETIATKTPQRGAEANSSFDEFWTAFPGDRKIKKRATFDLWTEITTGNHDRLTATPGTLVAAAREYASREPNPKFVPMPLNWLQEARWEDDDAKPDPIRERKLKIARLHALELDLVYLSYGPDTGEGPRSEVAVLQKQIDDLKAELDYNR